MEISRENQITPYNSLSNYFNRINNISVISKTKKLFSRIEAKVFSFLDWDNSKNRCVEYISWEDDETSKIKEKCYQKNLKDLEDGLNNLSNIFKEIRNSMDSKKELLEEVQCNNLPSISSNAKLGSSYMLSFSEKKDKYSALNKTYSIGLEEPVNYNLIVKESKKEQRSKMLKESIRKRKERLEIKQEKLKTEIEKKIRSGKFSVRIKQPVCTSNSLV